MCYGDCQQARFASAEATSGPWRSSDGACSSCAIAITTITTAAAEFAKQLHAQQHEPVLELEPIHVPVPPSYPDGILPAWPHFLGRT